MKKLLLLLLIIVLVSFLLVGCLPVTPTEGEGEEGEAEITVEIEGAVVIDGKTYVSGGTHTITVTFPNPVEGWVKSNVSDCSGDYSKLINDTDIIVDGVLECGGETVLFPDADKKVWTGEANFGCTLPDGLGRQAIKLIFPCCASYVQIYAGECEDEACIQFPVIVDSMPPYAEIKATATKCSCAGCYLTLESISTNPTCLESEECCGDDCSGLTSWSINIYDEDPFDECCNTPCVEPIDSCSGTSCPIICETICLETGIYKVVVTLVDAVGNEIRYYGNIELIESESECIVALTGYLENISGCTDWNYPIQYNTLGYCNSMAIIN